MTRQSKPPAEGSPRLRVRGVAVALALAMLALHVVAGAASMHVHGEGEHEGDEVCSVCASFGSGDTTMPRAEAMPLAARSNAPPLFRLCAPLSPHFLSHSPRGPPALLC